MTMTTGALNGLKVIDCTRVLGGPFCSQWLGDHGAEVIKIEPPQGDETRGWGPPFKDGASSYFIGVNRSKRGIALDLRLQEGREILHRLLAEADVLIENFKTGTLEKWGIGYDTLSARYPRLIHARLSSFGADGPLGGLPGYDAIVQAQAGLMSVNGARGDGPLRMGVPLVDIATGMSLAFGIMAAAFERQTSGRGQFVEASLYDVACSLLFPHSANYFMSGTVAGRSGNQHANVVPYDMFDCGADKIFIGCGNDGQWRKLCAILGDPSFATEPAYATNADRLANIDAMRTRLVALLAPHDANAITRQLMEAGVPAGRVNTVEDVFTAAHTLHRDMVVQIGDYRGAGNPVKLSRTPAQFARTPPRFGQDTRAVLSDHGYSDTQIDAMLTAGAAVAAPP
ncbi:CoA transferase [Loktanella sp. M215]|nr:CoA transferase [Loktanella sp. M215]